MSVFHQESESRKHIVFVLPGNESEYVIPRVNRSGGASKISRRITAT